jgi:hypothetical protein
MWILVVLCAVCCVMCDVYCVLCAVVFLLCFFREKQYLACCVKSKTALRALHCVQTQQLHYVHCMAWWVSAEAVVLARSMIVGRVERLGVPKVRGWIGTPGWGRCLVGSRAGAYITLTTRDNAYKPKIRHQTLISSGAVI